MFLAGQANLFQDGTLFREAREPVSRVKELRDKAWKKKKPEKIGRNRILPAYFPTSQPATILTTY